MSALLARRAYRQRSKGDRLTPPPSPPLQVAFFFRKMIKGERLAQRAASVDLGSVQAAEASTAGEAALAHRRAEIHGGLLHNSREQSREQGPG